MNQPKETKETRESERTVFLLCQQKSTFRAARSIGVREGTVWYLVVSLDRNDKFSGAAPQLWFRWFMVQTGNGVGCLFLTPPTENNKQPNHGSRFFRYHAKKHKGMHFFYLCLCPTHSLSLRTGSGSTPPPRGLLLYWGSRPMEGFIGML